VTNVKPHVKESSHRYEGTRCTAVSYRIYNSEQNQDQSVRRYTHSTGFYKAHTNTTRNRRRHLRKRGHRTETQLPRYREHGPGSVQHPPCPTGTTLPLGGRNHSDTEVTELPATESGNISELVPCRSPYSMNTVSGVHGPSVQRVLGALHPCVKATTHFQGPHE